MTIPDTWRGITPSPITSTDAYNGFIAANVIFALDRIGLLEAIGRGEPLSAAEATAQAGDTTRTEAVLRAAADYGYLKADRDAYLPTEAGMEIAAARGYFTWAVGGYHDVFGRAGHLSAGTHRYNEDVFRDEAMVALGSAQCDQSLFAAQLTDVLSGIDFRTIADLGSGTSARVRRVVSQREGSRGLGIDISRPATDIARRDIVEAGMQDRVTAVRADVLGLLGTQIDNDAEAAEVAEVDTVMSFFLLHDLLADPSTRSSIFTRMREAFPKARTFVLGDTMLRDPGTSDGAQPVFSVGFELAHAMMGVPLHTKATYERLFTDAGLRIDRVEALATPHSWLYVLQAD
ncbi:class I SAM-dependent methyltransferase [Kitasatospora brasiliensis]|uniref:class I SAM-dependent methyltransferase n=1 Tax=Kitasatospora brasiliensis TaxID=3058040 RepID=UPI00292FF870|nr:class I SAM-dependent methyltransferase [Kitasatospora sp. K002]